MEKTRNLLRPFKKINERRGDRYVLIKRRTDSAYFLGLDTLDDIIESEKQDDIDKDFITRLGDRVPTIADEKGSKEDINTEDIAILFMSEYPLGPDNIDRIYVTTRRSSISDRWITEFYVITREDIEKIKSTIEAKTLDERFTDLEKEREERRTRPLTHSQEIEFFEMRVNKESVPEIAKHLKDHVCCVHASWFEKKTLLNALGINTAQEQMYICEIGRLDANDLDRPISVNFSTSIINDTKVAFYYEMGYSDPRFFTHVFDRYLNADKHMKNFDASTFNDCLRYIEAKKLRDKINSLSQNNQ